MRAEEVIDTPALARLLREVGGDHRVASLTLSPLSTPDTINLVRTLARAGTDESVVQCLGRQVWRLSEGNPFMVVETMRALHDSGFEIGDELPTPARVQDVVAGRLDRLSDRGRGLAALASVIGREFDFALLECAAGPDARATAADVEELVARHVLHVVGERFDFTHDRIREVAYGRLLPPRRKLLHAAVAGALETLYAHDLESHCVALSVHCQHGALWEKAFTYLRRVGVTAANRAAHREAVACFEQALEAIGHLPESRTWLERAIDLRFALRSSLAALGEYGPLRGHLAAAEATARKLDDRLRLGWVSAYRTNALIVLGENESAIAAGESACAAAAEADDARLQIAANLFLGQACHTVGQYGRGADLLRQNTCSLEAELGRRGDGPTQQVYSRACLACCLAELGEFEEALACSAEAMHMAEATDRTYALAHACFGSGVVSLRLGELDRAAAVLERGLHLCETREFPLVAGATAAILGYVYALTGRLGEAVPLLEGAVETLSRGMHGASLPMIYLGEGYRLAGRSADAAAMLERALDLAAERKELGHQAWAMRMRGEIARHAEPDDLPRAEASYSHALDLATALGMSPLRAHCHLALGRSLGRAGHRDAARDQLTAAADLFRSMRMSFWLPEAEAELQALG
jgi:tetratricopeptide (TPR) repeat protein